MNEIFLREVPRLQFGCVDFTFSKPVCLKRLIKGEDWVNPWIRWGESDVGGLLMVIFACDKISKVSFFNSPSEQLTKSDVMDLFFMGEVKPYCEIVIDNSIKPLQIVNEIEKTFRDKIDEVLDFLEKEVNDIQQEISAMHGLRDLIKTPVLVGEVSRVRDLNVKQNQNL